MWRSTCPATHLPTPNPQVESTLSMQALQPRVKELQAKYAGDQERLQVCAAAAELHLNWGWQAEAQASAVEEASAVPQQRLARCLTLPHAVYVIPGSRPSQAVPQWQRMSGRQVHTLAHVVLSCLLGCALQVETAKLYQNAGVNPLAGCLPSLATIPIFIGLYRWVCLSLCSQALTDLLEQCFEQCSVEVWQAGHHPHLRRPLSAPCGRCCCACTLVGNGPLWTLIACVSCCSPCC